MDREPVPLLDMSSLPTMPVPWVSEDEGECWIWGDFFFLVQRKPPTLNELLMSAKDGNLKRGPLIYHLALIGFYKSDCNPFAPPGQILRSPAIVLAVEQVNQNMAATLMGRPELSDEGKALLGINKDGMGPAVIGVFFPGPPIDTTEISQFLNGSTRSNLGHFEGDLSLDAMRKRLFNLIPKFLPVTGEPIRIGVMHDALGHPSTGLPSDFLGGNAPTIKPNSVKQSTKKGCLMQAMMLVSLLVSLLAYGVSAAISAGS